MKRLIFTFAFLLAVLHLAAADGVRAYSPASSPCVGGWSYDMDVLPGASNLAEYLPLISGKRVCILSNQTGIIPAVKFTVTGDGKAKLDLTQEQKRQYKLGAKSDGQDECKEFFRYVHIVDTLKALGVNITCIMSPEHGFRGTADAGEKVASSIDPQTGIEVRSLYGGNQNLDKLMSGFDVLVFDLQDVGVRFYTYYVTMVTMMTRCAKYHIPFIVLDRPNPIGFYTDGPTLPMTKDLKSGVGALPIPVAYGMTMGELAQMVNGMHWLEYTLDERGYYISNPVLECDLHVVKCLNYDHSKHYRLPVKPSPNLPNMRSIYLYPSICYFEGTNLSIGRGTDFPFQVYGSPEMTGCSFSFTPRSVAGAKNPPRLNELCYGVDLRKDVSLRKINKGKIDLSYIIDAYNRTGRRGLDFFRRMFDLEIGNKEVKKLIVDGKSISQIKSEVGWDADVAAFEKARTPYLLYD